MEKTTAGPAKNYTMNYMQLGAQQGWQCPICKRVLSPWTMECPCRGQGMETITTTGNKTLTLNEELAKHIPTIQTFYSETGLEEYETWKDVPGVSSDGKRRNI